MSVDDTAPKRVTIPILIWARLVIGLRLRGQGHRESGAFLLGKWSGIDGAVSEIAFYDSLDPNAYQGGIIQFHGEGLSALWALCRKRGLEVVADCHTHGNEWTAQSRTDQRNPMIPEVGHTALILPYFAQIAPWSMRGVGVHEYLGNFTWRHHDQYPASRRVRITLW